MKPGQIRLLTRFYRTDNKIMIFFLNNKLILFKCHILIALNLQSQTAISTIRQRRKGEMDGCPVAKCDQYLILATKSCSKLGSHWPNNTVKEIRNLNPQDFGPVNCEELQDQQ
jgi:hypothetical protein